MNLNTLKESPIFNLSLSSKELFHSNFLYWLANTYPQEFGKLFIEFCKIKPGKSSINSIKREKKKIDLSFTYTENKQEILIENKVKSIPYIKQLKKYSQQAKGNQNHILLSLSEPVFFNGKTKIEIDSIIWFYLSYEELNQKLKSLSDTISNTYHKNLLLDYRNFIHELTKINSSCNLELSDNYVFHSNKADEILSTLIDIRLNDFYLKKKYELFAFLLHNHLNELYPNLLDFKQGITWESEEEEIHVSCGMTRGMGLLDVKYKIAANIVLGIQIQGESYRMIVEDKSGRIANKIIHSLLDSFLWFNLTESFPHEKIYPVRNKKFNKFGNNFFYRSIKLGLNRSIKEIITVISKDIDFIVKNKLQLKQIITKANNA